MTIALNWLHTRMLDTSVPRFRKGICQRWISARPNKKPGHQTDGPKPEIKTYNKLKVYE